MGVDPLTESRSGVRPPRTSLNQPAVRIGNSGRHTVEQDAVRIRVVRFVVATRDGIQRGDSFGFGHRRIVGSGRA
jgi:hypothetical protein